MTPEEKRKMKAEYDKARHARLKADPEYQKRMAEKRQTPEFKAKEKEHNRKNYARHKASFIARTKLARSTEHGRAKRNAYERKRYAALPSERRKARNRISFRSFKKRMASDSEFATRIRSFYAQRMRELRKDPAYRAMIKEYKKRWSKRRQEQRILEAQYEAFMARIAQEERQHDPSQSI